tara:strand:+ start:205 stop:1461 length:1257 start_codon:yes stop_codon:yes gene_type:complete
MAPSPYMLGNTSLFGSPSMTTRPTAAPMMPAPATRPPAPTSAANLQALLALSGQDRASAFLKGLGAMGPALIAAGAPSTDPGAAQKNIALAGQLRAKTTQDDLARQRAANVQTLTTQMALQKAAQEKALFDQKMAKDALVRRMLAGMGDSQQQQGQAVQSQPMANAMSGPEPMVMPTAVQTPQAKAGQASPQGLLGLSEPMVMSILASEDPAGALNRTLLQRNDPSKMYTPGGRLTPKGRSDMEKTYRLELKPVLEKVQEVDRKMRFVRSGIADESGTGDILAVTQFIKMIDEGVVTAGELAVQQGANSIIGQMRTWFKQAKKGDVLDVTLRQNIKRLAGMMEQNTYATYRTQVELAKKGALELGLRWDTQIWRGGDRIFGNRSRRQPTGTNPTSTLKPKPNQSSIGSQVPGLEPIPN